MWVFRCEKNPQVGSKILRSLINSQDKYSYMTVRTQAGNNKKRFRSYFFGERGVLLSSVVGKMDRFHRWPVSSIFFSYSSLFLPVYIYIPVCILYYVWNAEILTPVKTTLFFLQ